MKQETTAVEMQTADRYLHQDFDLSTIKNTNCRIAAIYTCIGTCAFPFFYNCEVEIRCNFQIIS